MATYRRSTKVGILSPDCCHLFTAGGRRKAALMSPPTYANRQQAKLARPAAAHTAHERAGTGTGSGSPAGAGAHTLQ